MNRMTSRMADGTAYIKSETGTEGVGYYTTKRRIPEMISRLAKYEDEAEQREKGCMDCNGKKPVCYTESGIKKQMNFCATCGRDLRGKK